MLLKVYGYLASLLFENHHPEICRFCLLKGLPKRKVWPETTSTRFKSLSETKYSKENINVKRCNKGGDVYAKIIQKGLVCYRVAWN